MTRARSSRPVPKRGKGKSFAEVILAQLGRKPVSARKVSGLQIDLAPTPPDAGEAEQ